MSTKQAARTPYFSKPAPVAKRAQKLDANDAAILKWMGLLGHPYAVTYEDLSGNRVSAGECNDEKTARTWAAERLNGRAFKKTPKGYRQII